MKTAKTLAFLGSLSTLGFGIWHFSVPGVHKWFSYIPGAPAELIKAIETVNFFLSLELTILGTMGIIFVLKLWHSRQSLLLYLGLMSLLWLIRFAYQLASPLGSELPVLWQSMIYGSFVLTAIFFIVPCVLVVRNKY